MSGESEAMDDIRPVVATGGAGNLGLWVFLAILLVGGFAIFSAMNARRTAMQAPATTFAPSDTGGRISAPPPLGVPARFRDGVEPVERPVLIRRVRPELPATPVPAPQPTALPAAPRAAPPPPAASFWDDPSLSNPPGLGPALAGPVPPQTAAINDPDRVNARSFANPGFTIPKGTVIPAVLETALDSTRPGAVRALVQRNIHGFDGSRVLVQRGSRLYGEYEADLVRGQKRALIRWTRLIRPDGVTVALDSPASDPLGRAGVKGKVNGKFFQRFGGAILQSVLDIGVGVATSKATDGVVVALPGSTQNISTQRAGDVQPTLKVRHGTSVSVFVAKDLDFTSVDR